MVFCFSIFSSDDRDRRHAHDVASGGNLGGAFFGVGGCEGESASPTSIGGDFFAAAGGGKAIDGGKSPAGGCFQGGLLVLVGGLFVGTGPATTPGPGPPTDRLAAGRSASGGGALNFTPPAVLQGGGGGGGFWFTPVSGSIACGGVGGCALKSSPAGGGVGATCGAVAVCTRSCNKADGGGLLYGTTPRGDDGCEVAGDVRVGECRERASSWKCSSIRRPTSTLKKPVRVVTARATALCCSSKFGRASTFAVRYEISSLRAATSFWLCSKVLLSSLTVSSATRNIVDRQRRPPASAACKMQRVRLRKLEPWLRAMMALLEVGPAVVMIFQFLPAEPD